MKSLRTSAWEASKSVDCVACCICCSAKFRQDHGFDPPFDLRLNTGIDPTSHWTSEQWTRRTLLARRSEYRWDISNRSPAFSSSDPSSYKIRNIPERR